MGWFKVVRRAKSIVEGARRAQAIRSKLRGDLIPRLKSEEVTGATSTLSAGERRNLIEVADGLEFIGRKLGDL